MAVPRSFATWLLAQGVGRRMLLTAARRGDLISQLTMDPEMRRDPFAGYEELRAGGPIVRGRLVAATVHHAAANQILRSGDFGVGAGHGELPAPARRMLARVQDPEALGPVDPPSLLALDPPDHTRLRKLVAREFTARSVSRLTDQVTGVAEGLLDRIEESGASEFDLVEEYAARLPVAVIADILGVPPAMHHQLLDWGNRAALALDPGLSWRDHRLAEGALREMSGWFDAHISELRRHPGEDLLSRLAVMTGEDVMTDLELRGVGLLVLGAGFETTVNLIGNAVVTLHQNPEQLEVLRDRPELWSNLADEVLRYESPVQLTMRQAYTDTEVAGVPMRSGEAVVVMLAGANRDPEVFPDPATFDVARPNSAEHLALSAGAHYCLGAGLARLEGQVALRTLYERFPDVAMTGAPTRRRTRVLRGHEHLPVRIHPRRRAATG